MVFLLLRWAGEPAGRSTKASPSHLSTGFPRLVARLLTVNLNPE
jgi:hypothetical protein